MHPRARVGLAVCAVLLCSSAGVVLADFAAAGGRLGRDAEGGKVTVAIKPHGALVMEDSAGGSEDAALEKKSAAKNLGAAAAKDLAGGSEVSALEKKSAAKNLGAATAKDSAGGSEDAALEKKSAAKNLGAAAAKDSAGGSEVSALEKKSAAKNLGAAAAKEGRSGCPTEKFEDCAEPMENCKKYGFNTICETQAGDPFPKCKFEVGKFYYMTGREQSSLQSPCDGTFFEVPERWDCRGADETTCEKDTCNERQYTNGESLYLPQDCTKNVGYPFSQNCTLKLYGVYNLTAVEETWLDENCLTGAAEFVQR